VTVICAVLLGFMAVFATAVVRIAFSPEFLPIVPLIRILAVGVLVRCACKVFDTYLVGTNRPGAASTAVALGVGTNLAVLCLLLPALGLPGAALAMTAGYFVSSAMLALSFVRFSHMPLRDVCRFKRSDWSALARAFRGLRGRLNGPARDTA
jgi:O-antigen/teichoic acid export membrane protein